MPEFRANSTSRWIATDKNWSRKYHPSSPPMTAYSWLPVLILLLTRALAVGTPEVRDASVSALGRLEPAGGLVHVAAPYSIQGPSILGELLVRDGESVTNAQLLARTHTHAASLAAWRHAERLAEAARARQTQAEAGAKPAEIATLAAEVQRDAAQLADAQRELQRLNRLRAEGAVSQQSLDEAHTRWLTRSNIVESTSRRLAAGQEVRAEDVAVARAEVAVAVAQAERALEELNQTIIRAPQAGQILALHVRTGEQVGPEGLLDLGRTDVMDVKVEVYETDIRKVRIGQKTEVTGDAFPQKLTGKVEQIGRQVRKHRLLNPDPSEFADARVVEVTVRLDNGVSVSGLTGALVNVRILP